MRTPTLPPGGAAAAHPMADKLPRSSDLMAAIAAIEADAPVGEWTVGGVEIWPLVRVRWFFAEWARLYGSRSGADARRAGVLGTMAAGALNGRRARHDDPAGEDDRAPQRDLVLVSDGLSFARLGERWIERFCDPVMAKASANGVSSALWTPLHHRHRPRMTRSRWVQGPVDRANLIGAMRAKLAPPSCRLDGLDKALRTLSRRGLGIDPMESTRIVSDGARLLSVARLYGRWLRRSKPRLAFIVSYYGLEGMAFVLACRRLDIPVVDLQHGVQGEFHPAYAAWPKLPAGRSHLLLPDRFWVWSSWEASTISAWSAGTAHAPVVGGNPWLDVWRTDSEWPGVASARERALALKSRADGRPVVLVTLQFGFSPSAQLEPLASLLSAIDGRMVLWVRLHPAMLDSRSDVKRRMAAAGSAYEVDACTDLPLHALLPLVDAHCTHSSTTVIEAAQFGVRSAVTSAYGAELFEQLIDSGFVTVSTGDSGELADTLAGLVRRVAPHPTEAAEATTDSALQLLLATATANQETA